MKILSLSLLTGLALAGTLASAKAQTAVSLDLANLRSGPGTGYAVITTVPPNAPLNILRCRNSWCRVSWQGQTGYIAASLLGRTRGSFVAAAPPPATVYVGPSVVVGGPYIDPYWDDWGYGWGGGWGPAWAWAWAGAAAGVAAGARAGEAAGLVADGAGAADGPGAAVSAVPDSRAADLAASAGEASTVDLAASMAAASMAAVDAKA
ncbi:exported protein of unknown function [Methylocella tundrae]|uniref:SH3b domain-containing protein n=1 Tax=Methylocella tundrae TaxID=227605 RepID=A0A4U8Z3H4_METTU|nr:SH3 domain-containing protein [Methylocella tundrae]VFU09997.1 exported protein of unknown function [Methylocella tundrae]